jgi:hypothetical protein
MFFGIDPALLSTTSIKLVRTLFLNLGLDFHKHSSDIAALGEDGKLNSALLLASFNANDKNQGQIDNLKPQDFYPGKQVDNHFWERATALNGVFNFNTLNFDGPKNDAVAYLSFWVYSPHALSNLLLEPDLPRVDLYLNSDDACQVFLNNKLIKDMTVSNDFPAGRPAIKALPLEKGWNHFIIKTIQKNGKWTLEARFDCDKKAFLQEMKSQIAH